MVGTILIVAAFILALIESFAPYIGSWTRPHLGWLALALYFLALVLGTGGHL